MIIIIMIIIIIERKNKKTKNNNNNNNNHNNSENDNNNYYYCNESLSADKDIDNRIHSDNYKTTIITRDQTLRSIEILLIHKKFKCWEN